MNAPLQKLLEKFQEEYQFLKNTKQLASSFEQLNIESNRIIYSYQAANLSYNKDRNRYPNVLAPDHSRFICHHLPYINASVINNKYILTQGPLKKYIDEFWTMVFGSNAKVILCLTKEMERNKTKFDLYYDDTVEKNFGRFRVKVDSKQTNQNIIVRNLSVSIINYLECEPDFLPEEEMVETRQIVQIQYIGWPDFKQPSDMTEFLQIFDMINGIATPSIETPLIIHCSAGVGRSGTWLVIHLVIEHAKNILAERVSDLSLKKPFVANLILELRKNRPGLVQSASQFEFCYLAIIEGLKKLLK